MFPFHGHASGVRGWKGSGLPHSGTASGPRAAVGARGGPDTRNHLNEIVQVVAEGVAGAGLEPATPAL